jgi:hypothetical protein
MVVAGRLGQDCRESEAVWVGLLGDDQLCPPAITERAGGTGRVGQTLLPDKGVGSRSPVIDVPAAWSTSLLNLECFRD